MTKGPSEGRTVIQFDPKQGYPAGSKIEYKCLRCGDTLPSVPSIPVQCSCRNVRIDVDAGRVSVDDHEKFH